MSDAPKPVIPGYELKHELGAGGMATVYLAVQTSLDRKVAIKVMHVSSKDEEGPERIEKRFLREGRMLARLSHRNVCGIYDIAKVGDIAYIAMEYLDGGTLSDRLRRGMTAGDAIGVIVQLAAALSAAHALGIVHRDLKPANVMMRGKVPVLSDFGIARDLSPDRTEITGDSILGTPNYMSPEQISGKDIDGRADIYSLGAMLFELLTGNRPYVGDSPIAVCMQHLQAPIPELPPTFADLQPIIDGMMAKDREERFADMASVIVELRAILQESQVLREALRFDTDLPWSEQLRELGFSFDTTGNAEVRVALAASRAAAQNSRETARLRTEGTGPRTNTQRLRDQPARDNPATAPTPEPKKSRTAMFAIIGVVVAVLIAVGAWWAFGEERLSAGQLALLRGSSKQFDVQLAAGNLVVPQDDSALDSLQGMFTISRKHPDVSSREEKFKQAIDAKFAELNTDAEFGEARDLLTQSALVFSDSELDERLAKLDAAQASASRDEEVVARLNQVELLLTGPQGLNDPALASALAELVRLSVPTDPRYGDLTNRISGLLGSRLQAAVAARELGTAVAVRDRLRELLPDADATRNADAAVEQLGNLLAAQATQSQTLELLREEPLRVDTIELVLANLTTLEAAKLTEVVASVRSQLLARSSEAARKALADKDLPRARALLTPMLARFSADNGLSALDVQLSADEKRQADALRAKEEAMSAGRLALDASPWGEVLSVVGSDGKEQPLTAGVATPLLMTLPEGRYTITVQGPDGKSRQQAAAEVKRGQLSVTALRFAALDADAYLKQAGYR